MPVRPGVLDWLLNPMAGPIAAGILLALIMWLSSGSSAEGSLLAGLAFLCVASTTSRPQAWRRFLSPPGTLAFSAAGAVAAVLIVVALQLVVGPPQLRVDQLALVFVLACSAGVVPRALVDRYWHPERKLRVAVIGSAWATESLARELRISPVSGYVVVGRIACAEGEGQPDGAEVPILGWLGDLGSAVAEHRVDLLVMSGEAPRLRVFDEVESSCLHLGVRLWQLSAFYEEVFGHVPAAEINAAWFQYILHPHYRTSSRRHKRAFDLAVGVTAAVLLLPLAAALALLIRRDGGPALFRQVRIGERGRLFVLYKLRTMRPDTEVSCEWSSADDPRVTPIGRVLRKLHLDEIPQLINVLRGEMSIVGPRPEQFAFVEQLEADLPFYHRRHLIKPGITGWAQVRCGYAGSHVGSAWKLCHDLYYVKHGRLIFDLAIIAETVRTFFADPQYTARPKAVEFIVGANWGVTEPALTLPMAVDAAGEQPASA